MEPFILWSGFVGAWLLVMGPVFQASTELREEELDREGIATAAGATEPPARVSGWWWFIPPVAYLLIQHAEREYRRRTLQALTPEQREQIVGFRNKARGWLLVALGAYFIAIKETWELAHGSEWPEWLFWMLIFVMLALCLIYTVYSAVRAERALGRDRPPRPDGGRRRRHRGRANATGA